jgi:hypothetical protein
MIAFPPGSGIVVVVARLQTMTVISVLICADQFAVPAAVYLPVLCMYVMRAAAQRRMDKYGKRRDYRNDRAHLTSLHDSSPIIRLATTNVKSNHQLAVYDRLGTP